jgi:translation initiation factor 4A
VQVLVLAPTRELAQQIAIVYKFLGEYLNVKVQYFIGGTQVKNDIKNLESGVHVVVGTPGRVLDMLKKNILKLNYLKAFVLDEADEMLSKGFLENMKEVITYIPTDCKVNLFSATMPKEIVTLTNNFMTNPAKILVKNEQLTLEGIKQYYLILKKDWKLEYLLDIYKGVDIAQAIIFCNSKRNVECVAEEMKKRGHMISCIHADLPMMERDRVMKEFRSGATRVLITTDLLARGIDVYQVSIVINYDLPQFKETYIHRIGRSGRFGRKGNAINFVTTDEKEELEVLQKYYNTTIESLPSDLSEIK